MQWSTNENMNEIGRKKHVREPPSVPFLWEVKPGIPKKDWNPEVPSVSHFPKTPLKLIASVPFVWEEKPGTPLPNFSHSSVESAPPKPAAVLIHVASSSSSEHTVAASNYFHYDKDRERSSDDIYQDSSYSDDSESVNGIGLETFGFDTDEPFSSVPSLLANCLVTSMKVSSAIPLEENSLSKHNRDHQHETPLSPTSSESEVDSCTSSYATGRSSPTGATFLECLFPLYPPKSGLLEREGHSENVSSNPLEPKDEEYTSDMIKRPPTLGELIMMSRRRSNRRKATHMKKWDPPKEITRKQALGCFTFVTSGNMIEGLLKRKYFPRLKLVLAG